MKTYLIDQTALQLLVSAAIQRSYIGNDINIANDHNESVICLLFDSICDQDKDPVSLRDRLSDYVKYIVLNTEEDFQITIRDSTIVAYRNGDVSPFVSCLCAPVALVGGSYVIQ